VMAAGLSLVVPSSSRRADVPAAAHPASRATAVSSSLAARTPPETEVLVLMMTPWARKLGQRPIGCQQDIGGVQPPQPPGL